MHPIFRHPHPLCCLGASCPFIVQDSNSVFFPPTLSLSLSSNHIVCTHVVMDDAAATTRGSPPDSQGFFCPLFMPGQYIGNCGE